MKATLITLIVSLAAWTQAATALKSLNPESQVVQGIEISSKKDTFSNAVVEVANELPPNEKVNAAIRNTVSNWYPTVEVTGTELRYVYGMQILTLPENAVLTCIKEGWPDGQSMFVIFNPLGAWSCDTSVIHCVNGEPFTQRSQCVVWRIGNHFYYSVLSSLVGILSDYETAHPKTYHKLYVRKNNASYPVEGVLADTELRFNCNGYDYKLQFRNGMPVADEEKETVITRFLTSPVTIDVDLVSDVFYMIYADPVTGNYKRIYKNQMPYTLTVNGDLRIVSFNGGEG